MKGAIFVSGGVRGLPGGRTWLADHLVSLVVAGMAAYILFTQFVLHLPLLYAFLGLVGAAGCLAIILRPLWGYYLFVGSLTLEVLVSVNELFTLAKATGGLLFFAWALALLFRRSYRASLAPVLVTTPIYFVWAMISLSGARDTVAGLERLSTILQLILFVFITATILKTPRELKRAGVVFVVSTTVASLWGIVQVLRGAQTNLEGFGINRNLMAILIAITVPFVFSFFRGACRGRWLLLLAIAGILLVAEGLSRSRVGFLAFCLATVLSIVFVARIQKVKLAVVVGLLFLSVAFVLPQDYWERVGGIDSAVVSGSDTVGLRYQLWNISRRMIQDYPYLGVGPGNYFGEFMRYGGAIGLRRQPLMSHNSYLSVSVELGIPGGALFTLVLLSALWTAWKAQAMARNVDEELQELARAIGIAILAFSLSILSVSGEYLKPLWMLLGMSAACFAMARRSARNGDAGVPETDELPGSD